MQLFRDHLESIVEVAQFLHHVSQQRITGLESFKGKRIVLSDRLAALLAYGSFRLEYDDILIVSQR